MLTVKRNPPNAGWVHGWYVYSDDRCIVGPCTSKAEADAFILKILQGKPNE